MKSDVSHQHNQKMAVVSLLLAQCMVVLFLMAITNNNNKRSNKATFFVGCTFKQFLNCCVVQILYSLPLLSGFVSECVDHQIFATCTANGQPRWPFQKRSVKTKVLQLEKCGAQNSSCERSYNHLTRVKISMSFVVG